MIDLRAKRLKSHFSVLIAALLFGTAGTAQQFAPQEAQMEMIGALRLAVGASLLLVVALIQKKVIFTLSWNWKWVLLASAGVAAFNLFFFSAIDLLGVAVGTTVMLGFTPIFTGILGYLVHGERLRKTWYLATAIAVTGVVFLTYQDHQASFSLPGFFKAIAAGFSYSFYSVMIKGLVLNHSPIAVMSVISSIGFLLLTPLVVFADLNWLYQANAIAVILYLGVFATALAFYFLAFGLKTVPVSHVSTIVLAEPLFATLLGVFMLGEVLLSKDIIGILMILTGITYLSVSQWIGKSKAEPLLGK